MNYPRCVELDVAPITSRVGCDPAVEQLDIRPCGKGNGQTIVVNAGVSGETSSGALSRIQWVVASLKPDIVILETGANDGLRGLDPALLQANLNRLLTILKANQIQVVLAGMRMLPNLGPDYIQQFGVIYPQVAQQHRVVFIPFFLEGVAGRSELNQPDKIHPTAQGYSRVVENLYPFVIKAIENWKKTRHNQ